MLKSHVVVVAGLFVGVAVSHANRFRFVAVDPRVEELDGSIWPDLSEVQRVVTHLVRMGRLPPARAAAAA